MARVYKNPTYTIVDFDFVTKKTTSFIETIFGTSAAGEVKNPNPRQTVIQNETELRGYISKFLEDEGFRVFPQFEHITSESLLKN
jgi:hypothetical protein